MKDVLIHLSAYPRVCHFINVMVVEIPKTCGLILSRDWSTKLNGYFANDWSHMWLPYNNSQNQIKILWEPHMKYNVTQLEWKNEPVNFPSSVLGNYFLELEPRKYQEKEASCESDTQFNLLQFSQDDDIDCNIVNLVTNIGDDTNQVELEDRIWFMYFDGSKTQEGSRSGYILIDSDKNKHFLLQIRVQMHK